MEKSFNKNDMKKAVLCLFSVACAGLFSNCSAVRGLASGAEVVVKTVMGSTPVVKDGVKVYGDVKDEVEQKALIAGTQELEEKKYNDIKNNRSKYAKVASDLATYCLNETKNNPTYLTNAEGQKVLEEVDHTKTPMVVEVLSRDENVILRTIGKGYSEDERKALSVFKFNFSELSRIISDNECVGVMKSLSRSSKKCEIFPITFTFDDPSVQRQSINKFATQFNCTRGYSEEIQKAEDRLNAIKYRMGQTNQFVDGLRRDN